MTYLPPVWASFEPYDYTSSSYYRTKPFISPTIPPALWVRQFHISSRYCEKDKSVVEKAVEVMKGKLKPTQEETEKVIPEVKPTDQKEVKVEPEKAVDKPKASWLQTIKHHAKYYRDGFVLFYKELKISISYLWKSIVKGEPLTRREIRQLARTSGDLFRMIPYLLFLIIPFFELLIPFYLKFFPNALPSTFGRGNETNKKKEEVLLKEQLKRKLEMANVLQETILKSSLQKSKKKGGPSMVEEFSDFIQKVRSEGTTVSVDGILHFSKLFEDEITLDSLQRSQLQALCKLLGITPIGTDQILRFQLDVKLRQLLVDDKMILKEGIDTLTVQELQQANRARGMRALGVSKERLIFQLQQWLDMHLNQKVPTSLLLLSRALYLPEELSEVDRLQKTIQSLPKAASDEAIMRAAEISGEKLDPRTKIEILQVEQEAIAKETKERKELEEKKKQEQMQKEEEKAEAVAARVEMESEELKDSAPEIAAKASEEIRSVSADEELSSEDLKEIESAIENIALEKNFNISGERLQGLKEYRNEYKEDLDDLRSVVVACGGSEEDIKESKSAQKLGKWVDKFLNEHVDQKMNDFHKQRSEINEAISVNEIKLKYAEVDETKLRERVMQEISEKKGLVISINEMVLALRRLQKIPDEVRLQRIVEVLDEDKDGNIDARHVLQVIKLLGQENIKLESKQVSELIDLCKKEMVIEEEEKQKEKQEKEKLKQTSENQEQTKTTETQGEQSDQAEKIKQS